MSVYGWKINNKTISLDAIYSRVPTAQKRLKSKWQVLRLSDLKKLDLAKSFSNDKEWVLNEICFNAGRFGYVIDIKDKEIIEETMAYAADIYIHGLSCSKVTKVDDEDQEEENGLAALLTQSRSDLERYLLSLISDTPEDDLEKFLRNDHGLWHAYRDGYIEKENVLKAVIKGIVTNELQFPTVQNLVEKVRVETDYYDVSDELLKDPIFCKRIEAYEVELREYSKGYKPVQQNELF